MSKDLLESITMNELRRILNMLDNKVRNMTSRRDKLNKQIEKDRDFIFKISLIINESERK